MSGTGYTSLGLSERVERVLAYPLGWISGILMFLLERRNRNVQWHAKQSMAVFGPLSIIYVLALFLKGLLGWIPLLGFFTTIGLGLLASIAWWAMIILAVWLMVMAWLKPNYRLPFVSNWLRY